jgi:hypothetical protein
MKNAIYTLLIGLMFLASVYVFLVQYAEQANDYTLVHERMAQARWIMQEVNNGRK